jgi:hypothetical protein
VSETLMKARLSSRPAHHRALPTLLEALALWQGEPVRAALVADEASSTFGTSFCRDIDLDHAPTPLYTLDVVSCHRRRRPPDALGGMGDFRDLRQLLLFEVAR